MAYGIEVKNLSGYTQIDGLDRNLQIIATGTTSAMGMSETLTTSLPSGVDNSVVVFIAPNATAGVGGTNDLSIWGFIDYPNNTFVIGRSLSAYTYSQPGFKYIVCVANQTEPSTGYGFNTYTAGGDLAFSSVYKQMKAVLHYTYTVNRFNEFVFDEASPSWASGTLPQDYYVMVNALGRTGKIVVGTPYWYYWCSSVTWGWSTASTNARFHNRVELGSTIALPRNTGTVTNVFSEDTRTQVIARNI